MADITGISVTILMCMAGAQNLDKCDDGSPKETVTMNILSGTANDGCFPEWSKILPDVSFPKTQSCVRTWDSILNISHNGKILFVLKPDGSTESHYGFEPDLGATVFYLSLAKMLKDIR